MLVSIGMRCLGRGVDRERRCETISLAGLKKGVNADFPEYISASLLRRLRRVCMSARLVSDECETENSSEKLSFRGIHEVGGLLMRRGLGGSWYIKVPGKGGGRGTGDRRHRARRM